MARPRTPRRRTAPHATALAPTHRSSRMASRRQRAALRTATTRTPRPRYHQPLLRPPRAPPQPNPRRTRNRASSHTSKPSQIRGSGQRLPRVGEESHRVSRTGFDRDCQWKRAHSKQPPQPRSRDDRVLETERDPEMAELPLRSYSQRGSAASIPAIVASAPGRSRRLDA